MSNETERRSDDDVRAATRPMIDVLRCWDDESGSSLAAELMNVIADLAADRRSLRAENERLREYGEQKRGGQVGYFAAAMELQQERDALRSESERLRRQVRTNPGEPSGYTISEVEFVERELRKATAAAVEWRENSEGLSRDAADAKDVAADFKAERDRAVAALQRVEALIAVMASSPSEATRAYTAALETAIKGEDE